MSETETTQRISCSFPIRVVACPHCRRLCRYGLSRWGPPDWDLYTDLARVARSSAELPQVVKCPHCGDCFWRDEADTHGYLRPEQVSDSLELFGVERIPPVNTPEAVDLEEAARKGLPRTRHEIGRIHQMAWQRLNDDLRFEPETATTGSGLDEPIRARLGAALTKDPPNRHPLTSLSQVDIRRQ